MDVTDKKIYVGVDTEWAMLFVSRLHDHVDFSDPDAYETIYDMTSMYLYWQVIARRHNEHLGNFVMEILQGYHALDIPPGIFYESWVELEHHVLFVLDSIRHHHGFRGIDYVEHKGVLTGFLVMTE